MAGASAEGEVNHWPAFVDVLTTVIMVVTFLLVIMSAAVMVLSQRAMENFKKQLIAQEKVEKLKSSEEALKKSGKVSTSPNAITAPVDQQGQSVAELGAILKSDPINGRENLTIRSRETPDTLKLKVKAMEDPQNSTGVEVKTADTLLRVDFDPTAVRYSDDNRKQVIDYLKSHAQPNMKYEIWSFAPQDSSVSEAQRVAFFRAAMTRNILIAAGIDGGNIYTQIRVTDAGSKDGHNVRVILKP